MNNRTAMAALMVQILLNETFNPEVDMPTG